MKKVAKIFVLVSVLLPLSLSLMSMKTRKGKIKEGRYYSANGSFSFVPPSIMMKPTINEEVDNDLVTTYIQDDFGTLVRLEKLTLPEEYIQIIREKEQEFLDGFFEEGLLPHFQAVVPDAKVLDHEMVKLSEDREGSFTMVDMPKGSLLVSKQTKERFDSMRGVLIFFANRDLVIASYQTDLTFNGDFPYEYENVKNRYCSELVNAAISYREENSRKKRM